MCYTFAFCVNKDLNWFKINTYSFILNFNLMNLYTIIAKNDIQYSDIQYHITIKCIAFIQKILYLFSILNLRTVISVVVNPKIYIIIRIHDFKSCHRLFLFQHSVRPRIFGGKAINRLRSANLLQFEQSLTWQILKLINFWCFNTK